MLFRSPYEALTDTTDYLQIDARAYTPIGNNLVGRRDPTPLDKVTDPGNKKGPNTTNTTNTRKNIQLGTVFLPIPSNIQDGNSVGYGDDSLNGIVAGAVSQVSKTMNVDLSSETAGKQLAAAFGGLAGIVKDPAVKEAVMRSLASQAVSVFGGNVTPDQILARQSGEIFNPNMELLFNGVTLRAFKFQFKMTPRDENEATEIRNIIRFFKYNMAPRTGTLSPDKPTYFLRTPNVFQLTYKKEIGRAHV